MIKSTKVPIRLGIAIAFLAASSASANENVVDILRDDISRCWTMPRAPGNSDIVMKVLVTMKLAQDGSLSGPPVIDYASHDYPALSDSVVRAIERCAPFKRLRKYKAIYSTWSEVHLNFMPRLYKKSAPVDRGKNFTAEDIARLLEVHKKDGAVQKP